MARIRIATDAYPHEYEDGHPSQAVDTIIATLMPVMGYIAGRNWLIWRHIRPVEP